MIKNKKLFLTIIVYVLLFYGIWTAFEFLIAGRLEAAFSVITADVIKECLVKTLFWAIPALLIISRIKDNLTVKKLFSFKGGWKIFAGVFVFFTLYILLAKWRSTGRIAIAESFTLLNVLVYLSVGLNEEIVFRGLLLNVTIDEKNPAPAIALNAIMFLLIHFPRWAHEGVILTNLAGGAWLSIPFLSVIFSYSFLKSRNIIIPALLHMWWDLLLTALA